MSCQELGERTPNLKFLFEAICSQEGFDLERMIRGILEVLMLSCQSIILLSLFMDVSGISMKEYAKMPKSNVEYWENKLYRNRERDELNQKELEDMDGMSSLSGNVN